MLERFQSLEKGFGLESNWMNLKEIQMEQSTEPLISKQQITMGSFLDQRNFKLEISQSLTLSQEMMKFKLIEIMYVQFSFSLF